MAVLFFFSYILGPGDRGCFLFFLHYYLVPGAEDFQPLHGAILGYFLGPGAGEFLPWMRPCCCYFPDLYSWSRGRIFPTRACGGEGVFPGLFSWSRGRRIPTHSANEGPVRIQYKCLVPKQNYNVLSPSSYTLISVRDLYISKIGLPILLQGNMWTDPGNI